MPLGVQVHDSKQFALDGQKASALIKRALSVYEESAKGVQVYGFDTLNLPWSRLDNSNVQE